jgi:hypothetical protein
MSGTAMDTMYFDLGVEYSYHVELRDNGAMGKFFLI